MKRRQVALEFLCHALNHEVEVESVAYIVCDAIGLDSGDYSFAYVARWSEWSTELLKETGERVIGCAKSIMGALEVAVLELAS